MSCRSLLQFLVLLGFFLVGFSPAVHAAETDKAEVDNSTTDLQSSITLQELSRKRAQLELCKIEVQLAREEKELKELRKKPEQERPKPPVRTQPVKRPAPRPVVISVQGTDGQALSATLKTRQGLLTVQKGDRVMGGVVENIRPDRVVMRFNGKSAPLIFQE